MPRAGSDGGDAAGEATNLHRHARIGRGAVAELPVIVLAPAPDRSASGDRTRMPRAGSDGGDAAGEAINLHRDARIGRGAVAELPVIVLAPAPDRSASGDRTRVMRAGSDGGDAAGEAINLHRHARIGCGAVAELPVIVLAPTLDGSFGGQPA
ncbi:MAG: hypothetical protein M9922_00335 [Microthrixaceae bacterium]|nr:hypothetical protein [Microthrixaceae bacterium]